MKNAPTLKCSEGALDKRDCTPLTIRTAGADVLAMTSREIAELTGKRHDNVMRVCRELKALAVTPQIEESTFLHSGNSYIEFRLSKRDSLVLVARLSPEFTGRVVDRWIELEAAVTPPAFHVPATLSGALRLAAEQAELIEHQQAALTAAAPAVEFVDRYVDSTGLKGFRQVCKLIGANENTFRTFLEAEGIMYRLGGEWVPYAQHLTAGRFVVKAGTSEVSGHAFNSAKFTSKGVEWIAGEFAKYQLTSKQGTE
jgi:phage antirepressor YoqD-like protein